MTEQETTGTSGYHVLLTGVDTLVLNVRYADENNRPVKQELADEFVEQFDLWQKEARQEESTIPTPLVFAGETLLMYPHGAGKGQWKWLLTCRAFNLCISRGRLNGIIAQVRFSSEYLWSSQDDGKPDVAVAMVEVFTFLHDLFGLALYFQVSEVHLCADMIGWDVSSCEWQDTFLSRARRRVDRAETVSAGSAAVVVVSGRKLATLEFGSHGSPLSCVIYNKSLEIRQKSHDKIWFHDLWQRVQRVDGSSVWDGETDVWRVEFRFKRESLHELKEDGVFHGIENADDLPERLEALWTYAAGHAGVVADGLPDGWLRYTVPSSDSNMARWPVHPAWVALQAAFSSVPASAIGSLIRQRIRQVNILQLVRQIGGCASTLSAWLGGSQDDRPSSAMVGLTEDSDSVPIPEQIYDYHFVLHWLHEQMPRYVMVAQAARVNPEHPDILWKKYGVKFAGDVQSKRVLYGLQADGVAAPALGSDGGRLVPARNVVQEVLDPDEYREWLDRQS